MSPRGRWSAASGRSSTNAGRVGQPALSAKKRERQREGATVADRGARQRQRAFLQSRLELTRPAARRGGRIDHRRMPREDASNELAVRIAGLPEKARRPLRIRDRRGAHLGPGRPLSRPRHAVIGRPGAGPRWPCWRTSSRRVCHSAFMRAQRSGDEVDGDGGDGPGQQTRRRRAGPFPGGVRRRGLLLHAI